MEFKVISALRRLCDYERDISEVLHGFYGRRLTHVASLDLVFDRHWDVAL